jgi:hypothetical protein
MFGRKGFAHAGVSWLNDVVDEFAAFIVADESALHSVNSDFLQVIERQAERRHGELEFLGHTGVAHEPIVGIQGDSEPALKEKLEGMFREAGGGAGVDIA